MSTKIIVPPKADVQQTAPASTYDVGQKVVAAAWAGVFAAGLLLVLWWALLGVALALDEPVPGGWTTALIGSVVCGMIGVLVTCYLGFGWVQAAAARPWWVDDRMRNRVWEQEDAARKEQEEAAQAAEEGVRTGPLDHDRDPTTLTEAQTLHLVAVRWLHRCYTQGQKVTRAAMCEAGLCTQPEWNRANTAMVAVGLKTNNTMRPGLDFETAWDIWSSGVEIRPGQKGPELWVRNRQGWRFLEEV